MREISKSPRTTLGGGGTRVLALHEFAAAIEKIGGVLHQLAPALEHILADVDNVLARALHGFAAFQSLVGKVPARFLAALGRVEHGGGHADGRPGKEPGERADGLFFFFSFGHTWRLLSPILR